MIVKACHCGRPAIPGTTRCAAHPKRWKTGSTRAWRQQRARILARDPYCTAWLSDIEGLTEQQPAPPRHPIQCGAPSTEVHHIYGGSTLNVPDHELRGVCHQHNPRGG